MWTISDVYWAVIRQKVIQALASLLVKVSLSKPVKPVISVWACVTKREKALCRLKQTLYRLRERCVNGARRVKVLWVIIRTRKAQHKYSPFAISAYLFSYILPGKTDSSLQRTKLLEEECVLQFLNHGSFSFFFCGDSREKKEISKKQLAPQLILQSTMLHKLLKFLDNIADPLGNTFFWSILTGICCNSVRRKSFLALHDFNPEKHKRNFFLGFKYQFFYFFFCSFWIAAINSDQNK